MTKWLELAHDKNVYLYPTAYYWLTAQYTAHKVGVKDKIIGCWYKNNEFSYLSGVNSLVKPGKIILKRLEASDKLMQRIEQVNRREVPIMLKAAEKLSGDLSKVSGKELNKRYNDWLSKFISMMTYSVMCTVMEMEEPLFSNRVEEIIKSKIKDKNKLGELFQILSSSPRITVAFKEEIDLLKLRIKQSNNKLTDNNIKKHLKKYAFISFGYNGPAWQVKDIKQRLNSLPGKVNNLLKEKLEFNSKLAKEQKQIEKGLKFNKKELRLIHALRDLGFWKFERKFLNQKAHVLMEDFINELCKRNQLTKKQAYMIAPNEIKDVLLNNKVDAILLNERLKESVIVFKGINYQVLSGKKAIKVIKEINNSLKADPNIKKLEGNTAFAGYARGRVKRIDEALEMKKMNPGDILVSTSTNPQIVTAMRKAGAIITDSGGITCHAAIVARELKVPCVIGTKIATKVLKDGDLVEVDATKGVVKKLG